MKYEKLVGVCTVVAFTSVALSHFHEYVGKHVETQEPRGPILPTSKLEVTETSSSSSTAVSFIKAL